MAEAEFEWRRRCCRSLKRSARQITGDETGAGRWTGTRGISPDLTRSAGNHRRNSLTTMKPAKEIRAGKGTRSTRARRTRVSDTDQHRLPQMCGIHMRGARRKGARAPGKSRDQPRASSGFLRPASIRCATGFSSEERRRFRWRDSSISSSTSRKDSITTLSG